MRKFLSNIVIFALIVLFTAIVSDCFISKGLKKTERGHFYTMNKLMNEKMNADVVILGNSRASASYQPAVLDSILHINAWNLGISGQPFGVSYLRWRLYQRNNCNPKLLIINIDYKELEVVANGYEREQYYPYMNDALVKPYLDLYGFSWADKHLPMYRYRGDYKLMGIGLTEWLGVRHDTKGDPIKGYSNKDWTWDGEKLEMVLRQGSVKDQCNPAAVQLLDALLAETQRYDIPVVFVYAPMINRLKANLDEAESQQTYRQLAEKYHVPILDFSTMDICADTLYFHDANHVNAQGAVRFSTALSHSLDSLGIINMAR